MQDQRRPNAFDGYRVYRSQFKMVQAHKNHLSRDLGHWVYPGRFRTVGEVKISGPARESETSTMYIINKPLFPYPNAMGIMKDRPKVFDKWRAADRGETVRDTKIWAARHSLKVIVVIPSKLLPFVCYAREDLDESKLSCSPLFLVIQAYHYRLPSVYGDLENWQPLQGNFAIFRRQRAISILQY